MRCRHRVLTPVIESGHSISGCITVSEDRNRGRVLRFGSFECDLRSAELRKGDRRIHLSDQPFRLLEVLLDRAGEIVTRQELRERLWPDQDFGDFDDGLNTAINKIRAALDDSAEKPHFIETIPRRGYRFIAPMEILPIPQTEQNTTGEPAPVPHAEPDLRTGLPHRQEWLAIFLGVGAALFALWWYSPLPPPQVTQIDQITTSGRIDIPVKPVSAGRRLYYLQRAGDHRNLMETWVGEGDGRRIAWPEDDPIVLDASPDASKLLVTSSTVSGVPAQLWSMPVGGGPPESLGIEGVSCAAFSPHGEKFAYIIGKTMWIADANGMNKHEVALLPDYATWLAWSPGGRHLRFTLGSVLSGAETSIWEISSQGKDLHQILAGWSNPPSECCGSWTPGGRYYVFTSSHEGGPNLWALRERGSFWRRSPRGPFQLTFGPDTPWGGTPSRDGRRIFFYNGVWRFNMQVIDLKTKQFWAFRPAGHSMLVDFSRDGQWIAYTGPPDGALYRSRADGSQQVELAPASLASSFPRWSPDGQWIVFDGQRPNQPAKVYVVPVNGGKPQALFQSDRDMRDADWSGHGNRLVVSVATGPKGSNDRKLLVVNFASRQTTKIPGSANLAMCRWSPDGRFISATSDDGTQLKLWDVRAEKWTVIAHGLGLGISVWSPDSRFLYFQDLHEAGEPLYRYNTLLERVEPVEDFSAYLKSGVPRCALFGVAPDGSPIIGFTRSFYDLYAAEVHLP